MAAALSRVYAGLCRRDRLTSKECPFWLDSLFCDITHEVYIFYVTMSHVRCAPAPRYNCPHLHFYFMLFCAPASHFTHPHLFYPSFPHPRSRRKVPNSAVWSRHKKVPIKRFSFTVPRNSNTFT